MKKLYMLIILSSIVLGILIGSMIKDFKSKQELYTDKYNILKKEIKKNKKNIKELKKYKEKLDKESDKLKDKHTDKKELNKIEDLKKILSYKDVSGEGLVIKIDATDDSVGNISNIIDYNKILINLVNELKINGAVFISINNQRINQYSEIILAGSHININSTPIAQPYEIKAIGDIDKLSSYINKSNNYLEDISINYRMKVDCKIEDNIDIPKIEVEDKLRYLKEG